MICDVNGDTLTLIDAVRGADGLASRIAPDTPLIVLTAHARRARARALPRPRRRRRRWPSRSPTPSCAPACARCCAAAERPDPGRVVRVGALTIDPAARDVRVGEHARRADRQGVRAAGAPRRPSRRACSPSTSCCATCGASARRPHAHARQPRLPAAPQARRGLAGGERWVENVWGVGYRLVADRRARPASRHEARQPPARRTPLRRSTPLAAPDAAAADPAAARAAARTLAVPR